MTSERRRVRLGAPGGGRWSYVAIPVAERGGAAKGTGTALGRSAKARGLQVIVSRNDLPQLVLGTTIPAIGVGMMSFHQYLELGLDIGPLGVGLKSEHLQRPPLRIENLA